MVCLYCISTNCIWSRLDIVWNGSSLLLFQLFGINYCIPVVDVIHLILLTLEEIFEEFSKILVIRFLIKTQIFGVWKVSCEFRGKTLAQFLHRSLQFLLHYLLLFVLFICSFHILPREGTSQKIHEHIS